MGWAAAIPWIAGAVGGIASAYGASQQNKAGKNAGKVDVFHEVNPYGDSGWYKDQIAQRAYENLFGQSPPPGVGNVGPQNPSHMPPGGPGLRDGGGATNAPSSAAPQMRVNRRGETVPVKNVAANPGGGKVKPTQGGGGATQQAIDNAMRVAGTMENSPTTKAAQAYTAGTLSGEDQNPYRAETAGMLRDLNNTAAGENYSRLLDTLWGSDTGLGGGAAQPGASSSRGGGRPVQYQRYIDPASQAAMSAAAGGGGGSGAPADGGGIGWSDWGGTGSSGAGPVGVVDDLKSILAGNDSPAIAGMQAKIKRQGGEALAEQQRALRLRSAGSGMAGGSGQDYSEGTALGKYAGYIADANASMYADLYGQALGQGQQYDLSSLDRVSRERMSAADRAAAERASANASSASAGAAAAALASQERMQRLNMLGDLTGLGMEQERFRASGFGSLGEGFSGDQRNALSLAGDVNGMGQSGWLNAGQLSLGRDQTQNQLRASLAGTGVQRQALEFDKQRYYGEKPLKDMIAFGGLVGGLYDPYAVSHDYGFDARAQSPSYSNPGLQGLAGAASGYQLGSDIYNSRK